MRKYFIASLCRNGILGGGIVAENDRYTYHTNKLSVPATSRNIEMKYENIRDISRGWLLCFPTVTVRMKNGDENRFILFRRNAFCACRNSG